MGPQLLNHHDDLLYDILFSRIPPSVFDVFFGVDIISTRVAWMRLLDWTVDKHDFHGGARLVAHAPKHNSKLCGKMKNGDFLMLQQLSRCRSDTKAKAVKILEALTYSRWSGSNQYPMIWAKALEQLADGDGPWGLGNAVQECLRYRKQTHSSRNRLLEQLVDIGLGRDAAIQVIYGSLLREEEVRKGLFARIAAIGRATWAHLMEPHQQDRGSFDSFQASLWDLQTDLHRFLAKNGSSAYRDEELVTKSKGGASWWGVLGYCAARHSWVDNC